MMCHIGRSNRWIVAALFTVAAAGCFEDRDAPAAGDRAPAASAAESAASADDAAASARRIAFAPCLEDPELECGRLTVPVDHERPRGAQIALAVIRAPALTRHSRGSIVVNPGGPGGSGVDFVIFAKSLFTQLRSNFDIVSFDPRGTARSQPVDCTFEVPPLPPDDSDAAAAVFLDEAGRRYAEACRDQHGALATQIGTNNVARDMDALRAALGERSLNYLGFSYGTILGASYATLFPQRVRAMVLDGNTPPAWFADYLVELDADGSAGSEAALRRLDQLCRAAEDCPLRTSGVVAVYDRVLDRLDRNPIVVGEAVITGASVTSVVFGSLYAEVFGWPHIVDVLARADAGDYSGLPAFRPADQTILTLPSTFAIVCDDTASRRPALDYLPAQNATLALYPRFGGANFGLATTTCSAWPRTRVTPLRNLETHNKVVLIGNDFDNATPMAWSRNMAAALGAKATLIRYQGGGHTIYGSGSACIDGAVEAYFRDLTEPASGLTCPAQQLSFGASLRAATGTTVADVLTRVAPKTPVLPRHR